jgi:hypothetical protein
LQRAFRRLPAWHCRVCSVAFVAIVARASRAVIAVGFR